MNDKTIQEKLCDRVYELLPEKKELEFGCEVLVGFDGYEERVSVVSTCADGSGFYTNGNYKEKLSILSSRIPIEIIGQPLRLADLLLAINRKRGQPFYQVGAITKAGTLILGDSSYKLQDDNILNQSDEFCKWALEILK